MISGNDFLALIKRTNDAASDVRVRETKIYPLRVPSTKHNKTADVTARHVNMQYFCMQQDFRRLHLYHYVLLPRFFSTRYTSHLLLFSLNYSTLSSNLPINGY